MLTLPNALSVIRILLAPAWVLVALGVAPLGPQPSPFRALMILLALGVTDLLDGYLARRWGQVSSLGAALDAIADKTLQILVLLVLTFATPEGFHPVPGAFLAVLGLRDLTMTVGMIWILRRQRYLQAPHRWHGKLTTAAVFVLLVFAHLPLPERWMNIGFGLAGGLLVYSFAEYVREGVPILVGGPQSGQRTRTRSRAS
ncbi:MAG: CDP-alcohol phosphatidyltransferase family protein [Myxococcota bacterium]